MFTPSKTENVDDEEDTNMLKLTGLQAHSHCAIFDCDLFVLMMGCIRVVDVFVVP